MSYSHSTFLWVLVVALVGCRSTETSVLDASVHDAANAEAGWDAAQETGDMPSLVDSGVDSGVVIDHLDAVASGHDLGDEQTFDAGGFDGGTTPMDIADVGFGNCASSEGSPWRSCTHCPFAGQLYVFYCSPESSGPCYAYPNTCVDPGYIDCQNSADSKRYPGLRERCAVLCARLRADESIVACGY